MSVEQICDTDSQKYTGNLKPKFGIQPCATGIKYDMGCISEASFSIDGSEVTQEDFLNCPSDELQNLKWSVTFEIVGQHNPTLHRILYGLNQVKITGGDTIPLSGICFETIDDLIEIPFLNDDDSAPVVTITGLTEGTDYSIESEAIDDPLCGSFTKYFLKPINGGAVVLGTNYVANQTYDGYDMTCTEGVTGYRVNKKFRFCAELFERVEGGVPKKSIYIFENMSLASTFDLPVIDLKNGYTRSTLTFNAADKSSFRLYNQSDR